jgi:hypothetical protein
MVGVTPLLKALTTNKHAKNKHRVHVVLCLPQGRGSIPDESSARYQWGIFVIPKGADAGNLYWVRFEDFDWEDPDSGGWKYHWRQDVKVSESPSMLGLVMVGKLPAGTTCGDVESLLKQVPLPKSSVMPKENCVSWVRESLRRLQNRGWAETFDIDHFVVSARVPVEHGHGTELIPSSLGPS